MIKNLVIGPILFSLAFSIGLIGASLTSGKPTPTRQNTKTYPPKALAPESPPVKPDFEPEFRNLPNFEYWPTEDNLIDVFRRNGIYRESEVVAKSGEEWMTLFSQNEKYEVRSAKAYVEKLNSVSFPGDEHDVRLTLSGPGDPVFAVRSISGVTEGPVSTVYHRPSFEEIDRRNLPIGYMEEGYKREFKLGDRWYVLRVSDGVTRDGRKAGVLVLEHDNFLQVVEQVDSEDFDEVIVGRLLWAGDLDNDGKLDLYFDEFNEKGYFAVGLYLSGSASPGELVNRVASFSAGGC